MKIAFFVNEFPSLSETFILSQIVGLLDDGHDIHIYAKSAQKVSKEHSLVDEYNLRDRVSYQPYFSGNYLNRFLKGIWLFLVIFWQKPKVALETLNIQKFGQQAFSLRLLYRSFSLIGAKKSDYDIIVCHFGAIGLMALSLKQIGIIYGKLCVAFHGFDLSAYLKQAGEDIYKPLFQEAEMLLPISCFWKKRLTELGCAPSKIQVHHMGIDVNKFSFKPRQFPSDSYIRLVSIARLVDKKGIEYSIRALRTVIDEFPSVEYTVIGDGPLMGNLISLIKELSLENNVRLIGWRQQEEVIEILDDSHILLAPSVTSINGDMEGIPMVLMEAMAMGLPVISTWHSGIPELISHQESGILVAERDVSELAIQILKLLKQPELWCQLSQRARNKVTEEFEINQLNNRLATTFMQLNTHVL